MIHLQEVQIFRESKWVCGRYCKYSRKLPQTPWNILSEDDNGKVFVVKKKCETSVQELLKFPFEAQVKCDKTNMSSSGREDVDVRMLGNGRPFALEFLNPRIRFGKIDFQKAYGYYKENVDKISVNSLQECGKEATQKMLEGAEEKRKHYKALCYAKIEKSQKISAHGENGEDGESHDENIDFKKILENLNIPDDVVLQQETPLRVLHRRSLAMRPRTVYSTKIEFIENKLNEKGENVTWFTLDLITQAGTYVKEFVHGDLQRTKPNISKILNESLGRSDVICDIAALDVVKIDMVWPPQVDEHGVLVENSL